MNIKIVYSFLIWVVFVSFALLLYYVRNQDISYLLILSLPILMILSAVISGILSYLHISDTVFSLVIVLFISLWIGIEFRADIGFWNYDGTFNHFLKIIKNCILYIPLTYFAIGYLLTMFYKKISTIFIK